MERLIMLTITKPPTTIPYQSAYPQIVEEETLCSECDIPCEDGLCEHCECFHFSDNQECGDQCDDCPHSPWCNAYADRGYEMDLHVIPGSRLTYWA